MNFIKKSLKYPQVTISIMLLTFLVGLYSLIYMPRREDAKILMRIGQVIAYYPGANSLQVEEQVTRKLEQYLFQYEEVRKEKTISTTRDGAVVINVWLNDDVENVDIFWSKLNHQMLVLKAVNLPPGVQGPFVNYEFGDTEALLVGIEMDHPDYAQLRDYVQKLEDSLKTIKAVSKIKRIGEQKEQLVISSSSAKLNQYGTSFAKVMQVLQSQNAIGPTGDIKTSDTKITLYSQGYYKTETDIADQIIGVAKTGQVVRLKDVAHLQRQYQEPVSKVMVNGCNTMLLAVQMREGNNIVEFGKEVDRKLAEAKKLLPANVKLTTIVNQSKIVDRNVSQFMREFIMAIVAVIVIIVLLLPFRVAAVAAMAIPMTIAVTFALMHATGIELHQVSLASLIVVLGMVVDDAVVVADNYVELLDKGVNRSLAAWKSATELVVPILTATLTIIAAFLPLVTLTGMVQEFIIALPLTVSIALASSFIVAMLLTPALCFIFIKKGLHNSFTESAQNKKKVSLLSLMQLGYDKTITWCMLHSKLTIVVCLSSILMAAFLYQVIPQKFFPAAERNQFVVDLWMPTGTKLEKTEQVVLKIRNMIKTDKRVVSYATFIGASSPRFYYNFMPEPPVDNFAQILVNTYTDKEAYQLCLELNAKAVREVPEGNVQARLMQQGKPSITSVEIRIVGDDIVTLKSIGNRIQDIIRKTHAAAFVRTDFKEDYYGVAVRLKDSAEHLGFTTSGIAKSIYGGFTGVSVSTLYEGNTPVDILLRLEEQSRRNFDDLQNMYLTSPATGAAVPLRQIALLEPEWHNGRIIHRNGLRTLTVQCEPVEGMLASQILKKIMPDISGLALPVGYRIEYGGEYENRRETFSEMSLALGISLLLIFLVLLFQFRNLKETSIVMLTIPLSMFGALLGLLITRNSFGFTAFVGLISLSGLVVRNAIILLDHANELVHNGVAIPTAALEAGKRRLRPIFLTASAAAIGVIPMIISGSPMWSPLASVIAVGIMFAMVISLLLVPVLYARVIKPSDKKQELDTAESKAKGLVKPGAMTVLSCMILFLLATNVNAQQNTETLNLQKVMDLAVQNNRLLNIKKMQLDEKQQKVNEDRVKYFPSVTLGGNYQYNDHLSALTIPQGAFGELPLGGTRIPMPATGKTFILGDHNTYSSAATLYQPISQIPKIKAGVDVSKTELQIVKIEQDKATMQVKQTAEKLYFSLLILQKQKEEAEIKLLLAKKKLHDAESAVLAGKATLSNEIGLRANVADEEQNLLKINIQIDDYSADMKRFIGLPSASMCVFTPVFFDDTPVRLLPMESLVREAQEGNTDLKIAALYKKKAEYAVRASQYSYLPDFGLMGGYTYQEGNALYPENNTFIGISLKWNIQEAFSNTYVKRQRLSLKKQAEENLVNTCEQVNADIEKAYRKLAQSVELIAVVNKVLAFRREDLKIQADRYHAGLNLEADLLAGRAALAKAEADLFAAQLNYRIALTELQILTGKF
ncbi:MAG: Cobalt-zinc-cadmium resistance protein CzcA [Smithella sp. PtaU1.Bin162]|nr:MAG: Cobalt-zinc-cadmium resistance protein CzcA [Smithella sp. PtaU1.Bin162]